MYVDRTYGAKFKLRTRKGDVWQQRFDDDRLVLVPARGSRILSGM